MLEKSKSLVVEDDSERVIDFCFRNLKIFPKFHTDLQLLYLANNRIKIIPENFFEHVPLLKWFDIRNNLIARIPLSIKNHPNIETMLLQNNMISYLPYELGTAKKLKYVQLSGNPIIYPKKHVIQLGTEAILKYLHLHCEQNDSSKTNLCDDQLIDVSLKQSENFEDFKDKKEQIKQDSFAKLTQKRLFEKNYSIPLPNTNCTEKTLKLPKYFNSNRYVKNNKVKSKEEYIESIEDRLIEDIWLQERKEILNRREKVIQDRKSLEALKNWRYNYKNEQILHPNTYYALDLSNIPYDIDLNYVKILTRADIEKDLPDKYKKKLCRKKAASDIQLRKRSFQKKMSELVEHMQTLKSENYECTPRTERKVIGCRIRKLTNLKNKLVKLKAENEQIL